jgi:hypothetical protein
MHRVKSNHPALKHGAYAATAVLPGESRAAFEKLHRDLIAEFTPSGVLEGDIVADLARLVWRKQNLRTLRIAESAQSRWSATWTIGSVLPPFPTLFEVSEEDKEKAEAEMRVAQDRVRKEFGDAFELVDIGEAATFNGLAKELDIKERLDALIEKCLKRLLLVRGVKSISAPPSSAAPERVRGPSRAA